MKSSKRIFINVISQYLRTGVCMILSLYSTRIILGVLGQSDYGIYALIGSIVAMIAFITSSLSISTQRFLSYSWGKKNIKDVKKIFSNALFMHIAIALGIAIVMISIEYPLVHGYLKIDESRLSAADFVYYMALVMLVITFTGAPIKALFIARENIVYASIVDIIDGVIKFGGAIGLQFVTIDALKVYAILMASISLFSFLAYSVFAFRKYDECHIPKYSELSKSCLKTMFGFTIWNIYSVGSTVIRSQGIAVIINRFLGTIGNAAYGITLQVSGAISMVAGSVINAMNPQLMKAEGRSDRETMLMFTTLESKYSYLILATLLIPVLFELPGILTFWLKDYPEHTVVFCRLIIISIILDQTTIGLTSANQAIGDIKNYSLLTSTIRLLTLPCAWYCLRQGMPAYSVMVSYLAFEILCGISRLPFMMRTAGLAVYDYCKNVFFMTFPPVFGNACIAYLISTFFDSTWRFLFNEAIGITISIILIYAFSLNTTEKDWIKVNITEKMAMYFKHHQKGI